MFQVLKTALKGYENYMTRVGRSQARRVLLTQDQRALEDMGISYSLLLKGTSEWPWREDTEAAEYAPIKDTPSRRDEKRAIRELRAMTNAELRDIGISRGGIVDAVRNGRLDNVEVPNRLRKDLEQSAA